MQQQSTFLRCSIYLNSIKFTVRELRKKKLDCLIDHCLNVIMANIIRVTFYLSTVIDLIKKYLVRVISFNFYWQIFIDILILIRKVFRLAELVLAWNLFGWEIQSELIKSTLEIILDNIVTCQVLHYPYLIHIGVTYLLLTQHSFTRFLFLF